MFFERPYLALISVCLIAPSAFLTSYLIAVFYGHVVPDFPYISETGTQPPTSCIFGQFLDIGALLTLIVSYIRYLHVRMSINKKWKYLLIWSNRISFVLAILSSLGITMVGNFQVTNVPTVHFIGAVIAFFSLLVYFWMQTIMAKLLSKRLYSSTFLFIVRLIICMMATLSLVFTGSFGVVAKDKFNGTDQLYWRKEHAGYTEHLVSTSNEWLFTVLIVFLFATFMPDFVRIKIRMPEIHVTDKNKKLKQSNGTLNQVSLMLNHEV